MSVMLKTTLSVNVHIKFEPYSVNTLFYFPKIHKSRKTCKIINENHKKADWRFICLPTVYFFMQMNASNGEHMVNFQMNFRFYEFYP